MKRISNLNEEWNSSPGEQRAQADIRHAADPRFLLMIPAFDVADPELSIVIPALNEALTIGMFTDWCHEGLQHSNVRGEILIVDSSTDATAEIAVSRGARVLKTPKRGLGQAYLDAIPYIRGKYVLMGDADCTYDFRNLDAFMEGFRSGYDYVMGSRFRGSIEPGAMPVHHRYFGTPLTTWILNALFASRFTDIHCGMRGITRVALMQMKLQSQSWEYATEMVLKSVRMKLHTTEVPVRFLKDQEGRFSHHKRAGWQSPWIVGWHTLKTIFTYGADVFLFRPGLLLLVAGLMLTLPLALGPINIGSSTLSLPWMLLGLTCSVLGLHGIYLGSLARVFHDYSGETTNSYLKFFSYTRSVALSVATGIIGTALTLPAARVYLSSGYSMLADNPSRTHLAAAGLLLMIAAFMNFTFTLALHAAAVVKRK